MINKMQVSEFIGHIYGGVQKNGKYIFTHQFPAASF